MRNNREFFKIEIEKIQKTIDEVSQLLLNSSDLSQINVDIGQDKLKFHKKDIYMYFLMKLINIIVIMFIKL